MGNINGIGKIEFYDQRKTIENTWNDIELNEFAKSFE
tara:strand:- start:159 stop:269 length:111 start_codon:yes stop_codon:yes gene_type:complete